MKKKSFLIIIMCILFLTGCGCQKNEKSPEVNDSNKVGESNNNSNETTNNGDSNFNSNISNSNSNGNSDSSNTGEVPYTLTASEKEIVDAIAVNLTPITASSKYTELNDKEKVKLITTLTIQIYYSSKKKKGEFNPQNILTKKNIEAVLHKYFGSDATMKFVDYVCYSCGKSVYKYDKKKEAYVYTNTHTNHSNKDSITMRHPNGVYKKGNIVRVKYINLFSDVVELGSSSFPRKFYATYSNAKKKKSPVITNSLKYCKVRNGLRSYNCNIEKMATQNKFYTYVYNFEKKGNEFYFVGYEVEV